MRFLLVLLFVETLILPGRTIAGSDSSYANGQQLHQFCQEERAASVEHGACYFYSTAVADVLATTVVNNFRACIPKAVKSEQVRDVVIKFLDDHPELRHYAASGLVAEAISKAFPC